MHIQGHASSATIARTSFAIGRESRTNLYATSSMIVMKAFWGNAKTFMNQKPTKGI
jgi:hypothetical protein